ncbi:calcium-binding protein [Microvirga subterranea]|uniref:Hemolysin type calcium-binding protein n=1 Tax=Microvirga subterranea TaxID=186651 RepID=A0A370HQE7_9HYPH|nr:calcium-binding protein [Microvirga subterranea]RDI60779.1 hemolysin type calcium-binding protein [Microvirga subterranea]
MAFNETKTLTSGADFYRETRAGSYRILGGDGNDNITVSVSRMTTTPDAGDELDGGNGNDTITAGATDDTLIGGLGADILRASDGNDVVDGGDGNDILDGGNGNDTLKGGAGTDTFLAGSGNDSMEGGDGADTFSAGLGDDTAEGGAGNDTMIGGAGQDSLSGGADNDDISGGDDDDILAGGAGADKLSGGSGFDTADYRGSGFAVTIHLSADSTTPGTGSGGDAEGDTLSSIERVYGSTKDDSLYGSTSVDVLDGWTGNDTLVGGGGADYLLGNGGFDTADYSASGAAVSIVLNSDQALFGTGSGGDAEGDQLNSVERVIGSLFNDTLTGGTGPEWLEGNDGADTISLNSGNDTALGGRGDDTLLGGDGNDNLAGGAGADSIDGGTGIDTANYTDFAIALTVDLAAGTSSDGDILNNIENIAGGSGADTLIGNALANTFSGGAGNDTFVGGAGADTFIGGADIDTVDYSMLTGGGINMQLTSTPGVFLIAQTGGTDAQGDILSEVENVIGSAFTDTLNGGPGANKLVSGAGNDIMRGGSGADLLVGNGDTFPGGFRQLIGDGITDGGTRGIDTFRSLDGWNLINGWETGERIEIDGIAKDAAGRNLISVTTFSGNYCLRIISDANPAGTTQVGDHETWVVLGSTSAITGTQATALANQVLAYVFVDPNLIA